MIAVKIILIILGVLVAILLLYLIVIIFLPVLKVKDQELEISRNGASEIVPRPERRFDVTIKSDDDNLSAWLYMPASFSGTIPCIVMSNGFGGTKDMILEQYGLRFVENGFAALSLDYRHFGASEGIPRQKFDMVKQVEDIKSVISYARKHKDIDESKIALWGTSAAGGYGLIIAAEDKEIACVIAQCPALDSREDGKLALEREGLGYFLRLFMHAQRDKGRSRFRLSPHMVPIVGKPGTLAFIRAPGAFEGYSSLANKSFINRVCARVLLNTNNYNPINFAEQVECPVLLCICRDDNLVSEKSYRSTAEILGEKATVMVYPINHFDIYKGDYFEKAVSDQINFLKQNLS